MKKLVYSFIIFLFFTSCKTTQKPLEIDLGDLYEQETLDTLVVTAPSYMEEDYTLPTYRAAFERKNDLLHTKLDIRFDWKNQHVIGTAELVLSPLFYATNQVVLDAKNFVINSISSNGRDLLYNYDDKKITITLPKKYTRDEQYTLLIDYIARPNEGPEGGSAAINSDKGLFFINPLNTEEKPQQIWTQGETENNSRWFPTIDKPNERCSQEIYITVDDKFATLSNGKFMSAKKNPNGTRTDYWKQEKPHAPYLFMVAVGEYAVVEDKWNELPLYYYVEPEYKRDAKNIFNHTPEMLEFFSDIFDYKYPWDKYAQVVCRDYVSGAMENTGAVVFGEFVQKTSRELEDSPNDNIVAHELAHHWFGDLVTCESWSNLTLNEGFANYSEYLWQEYKYGYFAAENHRLNEMNAYVSSTLNTGTHPLIHYQYEDKELMFDAHSYNKGGLVLHMLRNYVGDEAFFASLNKYLNDNEYTAVEADELRLAFEDVTGKDLNWFFDQWYFASGHPILEVNYNINKEIKSVNITVDQIQNVSDHVPVFQLPIEIAMYNAVGEVKYVSEFISNRNEEFEIPFDGFEPELVVLDGKRDLLAVISENRSNEDYVKLYNFSNEYIDKHIAMENLKYKPMMLDIVDQAMKDNYYYFRKQAISALSDQKYFDNLKTIALNDNNAKVRSVALEKLIELDAPSAKPIIEKIFDQEKSFVVKGKAIKTLYQLDPENTLHKVEKIAEENPRPFMNTISEIYADSRDVKYLPFFKDNINTVSIYDMWNFINMYVGLAEEGKPHHLVETASVFNTMMDNAGNMKKTLLMYNMGRVYKKLSGEIANDEAEQGAESVKIMMKKVIDSESDQELKSQFESYLD